MHRRYFPIAILTGILLIAALAGYLIPARSEGPPVRILLENKGGKVIFGHKTHIAIQNKECASCHHTSVNDETPPSCSSCHVKKFDDAFIASHQNSIDPEYCVSCHHQQASIDKFSHDIHAQDYAADDCQACHHDESIEPEPQACSNCHESRAKEDIPSLKDANHAKCADCHDDFYAQGSQGCKNCHTREPAKETPDPQACSDCHSEPADQLIPTTTKAFHGQCMSCHEQQGAGPYGDDSCYRCHMK